MDEAFPLLKRSAWSPALEISGIDVLDSLRAPIVLELLSLCRETPPASRRPKHVARSGFRIVLSALRSSLREKRAGRLSLPPAPAEVVFWPFEPTHVRQQIPTAAALGQAGVSSRFFVCRSKTVHQLRAFGQKSVFGPRSWPRPLFEAELAAERHAQHISGPPGVALPSFAAFPEDQILQVLRSVIKLLLPLVSRSVVNVDNVITSLKPKVLVVGNDLTLQGRVGCLRARQRHLPTACLMHGTISVEAIQRYHLADRMLVYGNNSRAELLGFGLSPAQVLACGAPYLDKYPRQTHQTHPRISSRLGLNEDKPWVLLALSGPGDSVSHSHHLAVIAAVMRVSSKHPEINFVAKLHRKDRLEYFESVRHEISGERLQVVSYGARGFPGDILEWLQGCGLVLTGASNVALEAMLMDVPVVTVDFTGELAETNFIKAGATLHVKTESALESAILKMLAASPEAVALKGRASAFLADEFCAPDGKSAQRCAQAIRAMIPRQS